jgi:hypothetical protein
LALSISIFASGFFELLEKMVVEEIRGKSGCENENYDNFPMGMCVLAVHDDPTCLRVLVWRIVDW